VTAQKDDAWEVAKCLEGNHDKAWGERIFGFLGCMDWVICLVRMAFCKSELSQPGFPRTVPRSS